MLFRSAYWRLNDYKNAEKECLRYLTRYGTRGQEDSAIRNLVDVYRAMGDTAKALVWIDRGLAKKLPTGSRQALQFSKAKVLFVQKKYAAAATIFRQLGHTTLRPAPGGTTHDEARYFEALSLAKSGNTSAAKSLWRELAEIGRAHV